MMGKYKSLLILCLITLWFSGCFEPPEYPDNPIISHKDIRFVDVDQGQDSLVLTFNFTDGDGDLGLNNDEFLPPFHSFNFVLDANDEVVELGDTSIAFPTKLVDQFGIAIQGDHETGPFEFPPFNCKDYIFVIDPEADSLDSDKTDTVLIEQNIYSNNIIVDFFRKRNGQYENITKEFSAAQPLCPETFNSRFPIFDEANFGRSLEGNISYALLSSGFKSVFLNDSIKIEFYIFDQALNQSNVVSTPDFTLPGLIGN